MIVGLKRALSFAWKWKVGATGIQEEEMEIERGDRSVPATLYYPDHLPAPVPGWVVLHGVTRPGRHHPTLLRFVRALAGTGAAVLVPEIPEWRELCLAPDEAGATIRTSVLHLAERGEALPDRIGVMGFSLGVPQVLLAATDPSLRGRLRGVAGFGGYGDLDRTIHFLFRGEHEWEGRVHETDPDPYGRWIVGGNYLTRVAGFEDAGDVAHALLSLAREAGDLQVGAWEACYDSVKEGLIKEIHPSRHDLFRAFAPPTGHAPPKELSSMLVPVLADAARAAAPHAEPGSFLERISVPVRLVHGRGDRLIPFSETLRMAEAFPSTADIRVYLTGLFAHSQMDSAAGAEGGVEEQLHFLRILSDLLMLV
jgi:pimeloyl-ACP methyl ester carboxylesterase